MNGRELNSVHFGEQDVLFKSWKRVHRMFGLLISSTILLTTISCLPYRKGSFRGPATVSDTGVFSYYRHHFQFSPAMPLDRPGKQIHTFRGLPRDAMNVLIEIEPFDPHELERLKSLQTLLAIELRDDNGSLLCSGVGRISESLRGMADKNHDHWVLANGGGIAELWRPSCTEIKFQKGRTLTMFLSLDSIDPQTPPNLRITPWIHGGGIELP